MKNLKVFTGILMFMCIVFSCTTNDDLVAENSTQSMLQRQQRDAKALAAYFKDSLWQSNEYRLLKEKRIQMAAKLNTPSKESGFQSVKSKDEFLRWVETNLSSTNFQSVSEAEELWNSVTNNVEIVLSKHANFFDDLRKCPKNELQGIAAIASATETFNLCIDSL